MDIKQEAARLRDAGFAIQWLKPNDKKPWARGWTLKSQEPGDYRRGNCLGIMTERLSGDLVCVDLDQQEVIAMAPAFLPPTQMVDGRDGKRRSHWYYRVTDIPPELLN